MAHPGKNALERIRRSIRISRVGLPTPDDMLDILAYVQVLESRLAKHDALITKAYEAGKEGEQAEDLGPIHGPRIEKTAGGGFAPAVALYSPQWMFIARSMKPPVEEKRMGEILSEEEQKKSYP